MINEFKEYIEKIIELTCGFKPVINVEEPISYLKVAQQTLRFMLHLLSLGLMVAVAIIFTMVFKYL